MKKTLAILLSVLMIVCMMPGMAFAQDTPVTDLTGAEIKFSNDNATYTGNAINPGVTVVKENKTVSSSDYTVSYTKSGSSETIAAETLKDAGEYTAKVTLNSDGVVTNGDAPLKELTKNFTIKPKNLNDSDVIATPIQPQPVGTRADDIKKLVILTYNNNSLTVTKDYTIDVSATVADSNEVKITAATNGNYTGSKLLYYYGGTSITDYTITSFTKPSKLTYDGTPKLCTNVVVKKGSDTLDQKYYTVGYSADNVNAGKVTLIVTGKNGYVGSISKSDAFEIARKNIGECTIKVGNAISGSFPTVDVMDGSKVLKKGVDFEVTPDTSKKQVIIFGIGNYGSSETRQYSIGTDISNATVYLDKYPTTSTTIYPEYPYDGTSHRPSIEVNLGNKLLRPGTDYDVEWEASTIAAKTYKVIIRGKDTYAGKIERTYKIKEGIITDGRLSLSSTLAYIPTGYLGTSYTAERMPEFTFYDAKGKALIRGTDYYVSSYYYNTAKTSVTIILSGKGSYAGSSYYGYNVVLNGTSMANCRVELSQTSYKYTGYAHTPTVKVYNGSTLVPSTYYIVSYKNNKDAGTASVTVTGTNGYTGSQTVYFTITGNTINTCTATLSQTTYKYDGLYKEPTVTVKDGYTTLTRNVDYKLTYSNNRVAGTATVLITGIGKYSGSMTKEFTIQGLDQTVKTKYTKYTKYPTSSNFRITATANGDGTGFTYTSNDTSVAKVSSDGEVEIIGTGIAKITVTTKGTTRYNPASKVITVTVKPNKPVIKVTSPSKGEVKVLITKVKGATKYQVKYGRNDKYYNKYITHKENEYTKTSTTIKNRKSGVYYYVQVRAYKTLENGNKVWSNWTTLNKVRAK